MTDGVGPAVERHRRLDPRPESARAARETVLDVLAAAGRDDLAEAAQLLVSELVTNAIVHARTPIELWAVAGPDGLRVAVRDRSPQLPSHRHYGSGASTGRGMELVEMMSDRHGAETAAPDGKTVWFELGTTLPASPGVGDGHAAVDGTNVTVRLERLPLGLALAWQQHADALLREMTLVQWDTDAGSDTLPADDVAAGDALAVVAAGLDALGPVSGLTPYVDVDLSIREDATGHFAQLDLLLDHAAALAERGGTLAPPTQPEIRVLRRWICTQVRDQTAGEAPTPWAGLPSELPGSPGRPLAWDSSAVRASADAVVAADDENRILAASPAALELLGWDGDLVGQRIVAIIPEQFRESHIAAFTLHLLTGRTHILDREVTVQARRRDGSDVPIQLLVRRENTVDGRPVFLARMRTP